MLEQLAGGVDDARTCSRCAGPGSMPSTRLRAERRREQQLAQVLREDARPPPRSERSLSSTRTSISTRGREQALDARRRRPLRARPRRASRFAPATRPRAYGRCGSSSSVERRRAARPRSRRGGSRGSGATGSSRSAPRSRRTCRTSSACRRARGVFLTRDHAVVQERLAHELAQLGVLGDALGADVARAGERARRRPAPPSSASTKARGLVRRVSPSAAAPGSARRAARGRARARSWRACGASACTAGRGPRARPWCWPRADLRRELRRQLALLLDLGEDARAARFELDQVRRRSSMARICTSSRPPVASLR